MHHLGSATAMNDNTTINTTEFAIGRHDTRLFQDELLPLLGRRVRLRREQYVGAIRHVHPDLRHLCRHVIGRLLCQVTFFNGLRVATVQDLKKYKLVIFIFTMLYKITI